MKHSVVTLAAALCALVVIVGDAAAAHLSAGGLRSTAARSAVTKADILRILTFSRGMINAQQTRIAGITPSPTVCRGGGFLQDLSTPYEWAPVVSGTSYPNRPTVDEPQFIAGGSLFDWHPPGKDILFSHPFGPDDSFDLWLDPSYVNLNYVPPGGGNNLPLHVEIENGLFPYNDFGLGVPQATDRVLVKGDWIVDCGHPENYTTEIHPPSFMAFAHYPTNTSVTTAFAFANPYRSTQLYNPDLSLASAFGNGFRFGDSNTKPFPDHLRDELISVLYRGSQHLTANVLVQPTDFGAVSWRVCTAEPPPPDARFFLRYRFTVRTGVGIQAISRPAEGCVDFTAAQGGAYEAAPQTPQIVTWPWSDIDQQVLDQTGKPIDVKQRIYDLICADAFLCGPGIYEQGIENAPQIDAYPALHASSGAGADSPTAVITDDSQPFPFYGHIRVGWSQLHLAACRRLSTGACKSRPIIGVLYSTLVANPATLSWGAAGPALMTVRVTNSASAPPPLHALGRTYTIGTDTITGDDATDFTITSDTCAGQALAPAASCQITVSFKPSGVGGRTATLELRDPSQETTLAVPLNGPGLIP